MDFLAGAMLWGGLAAALPVLLHLTGRPKPRVHKFAALRFLLRSQRSSSRALRLKHLLLLALRVLAILLLALTLARPRWPFLAASTDLSGRLRGAYVLVLDASLSMQFREHDATRFELARRQALRLLERLAPEARVALVLASEDAEHLQGRLTLNHEQVRALLNAAAPSGRGLDLARALSAARAILETEPAGNLPRAVVLCTDLQRNAYLTLAARGAGVEPGEETRLPGLVVADVGFDGAVNGAALEARLPGSAVAADAPLVLAGKVRPVALHRICPVDLYLDGLKVAQKALEPQGREELEVEFSLPPSPAGSHAGSLRLAQSDGLPADQERFFAYAAGRPPRVLVLEQSGPPSEPGLDARGSAFFLRAALDSPSAQAISGLTVAVEPAGLLTPARLAQQQVVCLADAGALNEAAWATLSSFVEEGGGLFVWLGPRTSSAAVRPYGFSEFQPHYGLLPGTVGGCVQAETGKPLGVKVALANHPLLARFTPGVLADLREVKVSSYVKVTPEAKDPACTVVLNLADGSPLALEKSYGRGRVLLCTVAPDASGSDLAAQHGEVFLTLVLEACRMLSGRGEDLEARLGRPLTLSIPEPPPDGRIVWTPPSGEAVTLELEAPAAANAPNPADRKEDKGAAKAAATTRPGTLSVPRIETPGIHRFAWQPRRGAAPRVLLVAANAEASESDLARVKPEEALKALAPWKVSLVRDIDQLPALESERKAGREAPVPLLLILLAFLFVESFLSNRMYRSMPAEEAAKAEKA